jgi:hypothetical protein
MISRTEALAVGAVVVRDTPEEVALAHDAGDLAAVGDQQRPDVRRHPSA